MVGNFSNRTACRIRNRRRRHDNNMTLRKKKTPRASQHYMGWRAGQKSLLLPVAGEFFLLTLPFIERAYRRSGIALKIFGQMCGVEGWRGGLGGTCRLPTLSSVCAYLAAPCFR